MKIAGRAQSRAYRTLSKLFVGQFFLFRCEGDRAANNHCRQISRSSKLANGSLLFVTVGPFEWTIPPSPAQQRSPPALFPVLARPQGGHHRGLLPLAAKHGAEAGAGALVGLGRCAAHAIMRFASLHSRIQCGPEEATQCYSRLAQCLSAQPHASAHGPTLQAWPCLGC